MTRIPAYQHPETKPLTQHQMRNIGNGNHPDTPLSYSADLRLSGAIGSFKASCRASCEEEAMRVFASATFYANEAPARILDFTIENIQIQ